MTAILNLTTGIVYLKNWSGTISGGSLTLTGTLLLADGTAAAPGAAFASNPTTGFSNFTGQAGVVGVSSSGVAVAKFSSNVGVGFSVDGTTYGIGLSSDVVNAAPDVRLFRDAANTLALKNSTNLQTFRVYDATGTGYTAYGGAGISTYKNIATAGIGASVPYASYSTTGNVGAVTNAINYTPPALAGRYRLSGNVNMTAWTTPASFTVVATYKDDSGNARTETLQLVRGTTGAAATAITAIDRWYFTLPLFAINNAATAITLSTTGTFTGSPVYNLSAVLEQAA